MGSKYDNHSIHHHHFLRQKSIFLPMLCKLSIKDIKHNHRRRTDPRFSDEPSSPKVTCMGQVKRNKRIAAAASPHRSYSKLKKLFSSKALLPPATSSKGACANNLTRLNLKKEYCEQEYVKKKIEDVGALDPPLPVVKRADVGRDEVNLWRRRFDGAALNKLQIQHINLQNITSNHQPHV